MASKSVRENPLMDQFRAKMASTVNEAIEAKEELVEAQEKCTKELSLKEEAETRLAQLRSKVSEIEDKIETYEEQNKVLVTQVEDKTFEVDDNERVRKAMAGRFEAENDRCAVFEAKLKEAQSLLQETESKYAEVTRRGEALSEDLEIMDTRVSEAENKVKQMEQEFRSVGHSLKHLEMSGEDKERKDAAYNEAFRQMKMRIVEAEKRATLAEERQQKLEHEHNTLEEKLGTELDMIRHLEKNIEAQLEEMAKC